MEDQAAAGSGGYGGPSVYLVPDNTNAHLVVNDPRNAPYLKYTGDEKPALYLDFTDLAGGSITLGRADCDITLPDQPGAGIHRLHCYFKCNLSTGAVILHDRSQNHTTQVLDNDDDFAVPMSQIMNSVVVTRRFNRRLAIGNRKYYKFRLVWDGDTAVENFLAKAANHFGPEKHPFDTSKARYIQGQVLGMGGFGIVWKAVNIHNGQAMAVKRFMNLEGKGHVMAIREINNMLKLSSNNVKRHEHILPVLDAEYDKDHYQWIEVFMPLQEGSVASLITQVERALSDVEIAWEVLFQMAKALKFMAKHKMVHRDIKPANILYETRMRPDGETLYYHFQLADFNLSNEAATARTVAGTHVFMAPEVYDRRPQTCAVDVWSLFVTILWIVNVHDFRTYMTDDKMELRNKITELAGLPMFANISDMADQDPKRRVSARDLVARLEQGRGMPADTGEASTIAAEGDFDTEAGYGFVSYISQEVQESFAATHSSSSRRPVVPGGSMDGRSAMAEFDMAGPSRPHAHHRGRIQEDYAYNLPRNTEVEHDGTAEFQRHLDLEPLDEGSNEEGEDDDKGKGVYAPPYTLYRE